MPCRIIMMAIILQGTWIKPTWSGILSSFDFKYEVHVGVCNAPCTPVLRTCLCPLKQLWVRWGHTWWDGLTLPAMAIFCTVWECTELLPLCGVPLTSSTCDCAGGQLPFPRTSLQQLWACLHSAKQLTSEEAAMKHSTVPWERQLPMVFFLSFCFFYIQEFALYRVPVSSRAEVVKALVDGDKIPHLRTELVWSLWISYQGWTGVGYKRLCKNCLLKKETSSWWDGLMGKNAYHQVWWPEFNSWSKDSVRREPTPINCPLICALSIK